MQANKAKTTPDRRYSVEVCILGGGATGAGIFRDLSLRGVKTALLEKNDLATGTSGRNHGLLHSGARYAVKDHESAVECIHENRILKHIGRHCTEDTGGFFVALTDEDLDYAERFIPACSDAGIAVEEISLARAFALEPHLHPQSKRVLQVPDGSVDPFRLTLYNAADGVFHGGQLFTYTEIQGAESQNGTLQAVLAWDKAMQEMIAIEARYFVNAAGPWAGLVARRLGGQMEMAPSMGVMVILDYRVVNRVINRLRMPADGDIIVPGDTVSIIGTTSRDVSEEDLDFLAAQPEEIRRMIAGATEMVPLFGESRMLRYYSGARPLPKLDGSSGREASRNFAIFDHADMAGPDNVFSIVGGKLMTYRLMAEQLSDKLAQKLNNSVPCRTADSQLPPVEAEDLRGIPSSVRHNYGVVTGLYRQGQPLVEKLAQDVGPRLICECEMVTEAELVHVAERERIQNISDLRRRTRLGMGPCQGTLCGMRAMETGIFAYKPFAEKNEILENFIQERWKGIRFILWGDAMRMEEFAMWLYQGIWGW